MSQPEFKIGDLIECQKSDGTWVHLRVIVEPKMGRDFMVVWVAHLAEWDEFGAEADGVPWPMDKVREVSR